MVELILVPLKVVVMAVKVEVVVLEPMDQDQQDLVMLVMLFIMVMMPMMVLVHMVRMVEMVDKILVVVEEDPLTMVVIPIYSLVMVVLVS